MLQNLQQLGSIINNNNIRSNLSEFSDQTEMIQMISASNKDYNSQLGRSTYHHDAIVKP